LFEDCPKCKVRLGGWPLDFVIPDPTVQRIVDILYPEFKKWEILLKHKLKNDMDKEKEKEK